jgi:acyl carrier protein
MDKNFVVSKLRDVMLDVFSQSEIPESITAMKIGDVVDWDSLGNFNLILECENVFNIRFPIEAISEFDSVEKIVNYIVAK